MPTCGIARAKPKMDGRELTIARMVLEDEEAYTDALAAKSLAGVVPDVTVLDVSFHRDNGCTCVEEDTDGTR